MTDTTDIQRWRSGKQRHRTLSENAAPHYDAIYGSANFATSMYMRYELEVIADAEKLATTHEIALDLGCGTGRDSFELSKYFGQVYGYDFSESMISVANANKYRGSIGNASFAVADVELGLPGVPEEHACLVNSAFGMGSFIEDIDLFFQTVRRILKPKGIAIFSFYNRDALVNRLDLEWVPALAARAVPDRDLLRVTFDGEGYDISAKSYNVEEIRDKLRRHFSNVVSITTFPALTALLPQPVLEDDGARELCRAVDDYLSRESSPYGPYIVAVVQKPGRVRTRAVRGYGRVLELFETHKIVPHVTQHAPVRSMSDVHAIFPALPQRSLVKSILVTDAGADDQHIERRPMWLFAVPSDTRLDLGKVARLLNRSRSDLRLATAPEVEQRTGFSVGSVPPFAMPSNIPVIVDKAIDAQAGIWCGTGKSTESLHLSIDDLQRLSNYSCEDVARPLETVIV